MYAEHLTEATSFTRQLGLTNKNTLTDEERTTMDKKFSDAFENIPATIHWD